MKPQEVCVIIPARNESANLCAVLDDLSALGHSILVVDDGSSDGTADLVRDKQVPIITRNPPFGYSLAVRTGLQHAIAKGEYCVYATLDADGAHDPNDLPHMLQSHLDSEAVLTVGSRFMAAPAFEIASTKRWANLFASLLVGTVTQSVFTDVASGFRIYQNGFAQTLLRKCKGDSYSLPYESILLSASLGLPVNSAPVSVRYDSSTFLHTNSEELLALLKTVNSYARSAIGNAVTTMLELANANESFTVFMGPHVFCIHALTAYNGYMFQLQNPYHRNKTIGTKVLIEWG